ncbi:MAG: type II secretion system F family protein [Candidatus Sericytochromatia bacterium]|nr:type II secretion system F family protein [Candidatus Sericytochromatia bacterium]
MNSIIGLIIPIVIAGIIFVSVFLFIAVFSGNIEKSIDPFFGRYLKYLEKEFSYVDLPTSPKSFMMFQVGLTILLFALGIIIGNEVLSKLFVASLLGSVGFFLCRIYLQQQKNKRKNKFDEQLVDAISLIANAVRSGLSIMQSLELTVSEMSEPISYEANMVIQATRVGVPLDGALLDWSKRMDSKDLDIFVTAVMIQNQTGGNLTEILETLGKTIRERFKIQRQIKALTAQGVMSAYVLTGLPIILGAILYFIQPETMILLFTTNYGLLLTIVSLVMIATGGYIVKKIITIDI